MPPRVSIGVPVYNGERHLGQAIETVLGQDYGDFELLISDNASTDATEELCRGYARVDPRVRYSRNAENIGAVANFRRVFDEAGADYFMWAAADDFWSERYVSSLVSALDATPSAILACGRTSYVHEDGRPHAKHEDDGPPDASSAIGNGRRLLSQHAASWIYGLYRRTRIAPLLPILWREHPWGGDIVLLLHLCLNEGVVGRHTATIFRRADAANRLAPSSARQVVSWQRWYASALLREVVTSRIGITDKAEMLGVTVSYLRARFTRRGAGHLMRLWYRAARQWAASQVPLGRAR
ncbi:MAG: glycosyltransferase family 2 protein [Gemmatimonadaceae bacterium]